MISVGWLALPVSMGVAIVRYRLFDLERLVSRTLTYVVLSLVLTGVFTGSVVGMSVLVQDGAAVDTPTWVVAVATVVAYVLFSPLRRRLQTAIDRRVHRRVVDAEAAIERAARRLAEDVDLSVLTDVVHDTVSRTMGPTTVAVWLPVAHDDVDATATG